ncbi:MAG: hypothetical protein ACOVQ3_21805 [Dolichospermum sp.]|jgi:hypothetical protein
MWKVPLLTVLQYLNSECNDLKNQEKQVIKVLEALVIICENEYIAEKILDTAEKYRSNSHSFTTLQELMEAIVVYE